jgi:acetyl/propionyl-CoA carboxylase alpha subunit
MRRLTFVHRGESGPEEIRVALDGARCRFTRGDREESAEVVRLPDGRLSLLFEDGRQICGRILPGGPGEVEVFTLGGRRRIALAEPLRDRLAHASGNGAGLEGTEEVRALMPGRVVEVAVAPGDTVPPGGLLLVLEAMKMQNEIRAERPGIVARIEVSAGTAVDRGTLLAVLGPESPASSDIQ